MRKRTEQGKECGRALEALKGEEGKNRREAVCGEIRRRREERVKYIRKGGSDEERLSAKEKVSRYSSKETPSQALTHQLLMLMHWQYERRGIAKAR